MSAPDPTVFDALAGSYDEDFTNTPLGRILRSRVWAHLDKHFDPGHHVLELACGTGEDALHLANRGVTVTATDGSREMIRITEAKTRGLAVDAKQIPLQGLGDLEGTFDGTFSNFGGLNTIPEWHTLARNLHRLLRPGATAVLVPMGPYCPWEIMFHLVRGSPRSAFRRLRGPASFETRKGKVPIYYPSPRRLARDLSPWFELQELHSLELALPPTYLGSMVNRRRSLLHSLARFEERTAHLTKGWGDHYIATFRHR